MEKKKLDFSKFSHTNNIVAIIFSVLFAFTLWFYIQGEEAPDYSATYNGVEVGYRSLPEGLSVISRSDNTADITLSGKKRDLNKVKSSDIEAYVDLSSITESGIYELEMTVLSPDGTELSSTFPKKMQVMIDVTVSKSIPVNIEKGSYTTLADTSLEIIPDDTMINIKGPKQIIDTVSEARVFTGNLGEVNSSFERNIAYSLIDTLGNEINSAYISLDQKTVKIEFNVSKMKTVQTKLDFEYGYWGDSAEYTLNPTSIVIKGEPSFVDTINSVAVGKIDETKVDTNRLFKKFAPSDFILPEGIKLADNVKEAQADIKISDNVSRKINVKLNSSHVFVTAAPNLGHAFAADSININVRGKAGEIQNAKIDDFYLYIDLSNYASAGEQTAEIKIVQTDSTKGKYYAVGEYSVTVLLTGN